MTEIYLTQETKIKVPIHARLKSKNYLFVGNMCLRKGDTYIFEEKDFWDWHNSHKFEVIPQPVKEKEKVKK